MFLIFLLFDVGVLGCNPEPNKPLSLLPVGKGRYVCSERKTYIRLYGCETTRVRKRNLGRFEETSVGRSERTL